MGFLGVYRAIYDYTPQADNELAIQHGDLLYIIEKNGDDGWWKAKKRAGADEEDEPTGLVPNNYVQEAESLSRARAVYEYTRQTDEELSFSEDAVLLVFDVSDPDWILVGLDGDFGFVPANYIEMQEASQSEEISSPAPPPSLPARPPSQHIVVEPEKTSTKAEAPVNPATAIAGVLQSRDQSEPSRPLAQPPTELPPREELQISDEEPPRPVTLSSRSRPESSSMHQAPPIRTQESESVAKESPHEARRTHGVFHLYNINEMVTVMGKRKKMPTTLGINLGTGTILIAPEGGYPGPDQEWTAEKMTHYSREGKHVFMELIRPSKSIDFHAGAKDTAEEIVAALGELAGAARAEGLKEVIMAASHKRDKKGVVLYDFMAQGEDEVTVAAGDDVIILDDTRSEEWWQIRRLRNGKRGVVPSSYIELTGTVTPPLSHIQPPSLDSSRASARSTVEQNRQDDIRQTKEAIKASKESPERGGSGKRPVERGSSLAAMDNGSNPGQQRSQRDNGRHDHNGQAKSKAKPDSSKIRTWTDRSKSFSVEAQFLGLKDGKIHLHKLNGVKIAVPITKMSREDLEYVEDLTGISLDDERPLADVRKSKSIDQKSATIGATIDKSQSRPEYDWFQFFLSCDVAVGLCERYAQAFVKDSMDESVLPDVDPNVLRNLGLREGDIIKVMRTLDAKYRRDHGSTAGSEGESGSGGLFSGPRGTLRNNTRKSRPAPTLKASDVIDATALSAKETSTGQGNDGARSPLASPQKSPEATSTGFDDDAWDVKPLKKERQQPASQELKPSTTTTPVDAAAKSSSAAPTLSGSMQDLSLLTAPLQPSRIEPTMAQAQAKPQGVNVDGGSVEMAAAGSSQHLPGASPSFFVSVSQTSSESLARQRPVPPSVSSPNPGALLPAPPQRPLSAPQGIVQQAMFSPPTLTPQLTGIVQGQVAPPGQSLHELHQARLQQQHNAQLQQMQPMMTGHPGFQQQGMSAFPPNTPTHFMQNMQPMMTGTPVISPFANPPGSHPFAPVQQPTGFHPGFPQPGFPQPALGTMNSYLPTPLEPQRTGISALQPQQTGLGSGFTASLQAQPLVPQKTGPPPAVRFGVTENTKKLTPQPTGRRANLAQATPQNPFGF